MMQFTGETTVGEIVAGGFRAAAVFHEFGIDFCCGGRRTLAEACRERNIDADAVLNAVERTCAATGSGPRFDDWSPEALISYIAFEHDLHAHVHLENNILFPKARRLAAPVSA